MGASLPLAVNPRRNTTCLVEATEVSVRVTDQPDNKKPYFVDFSWN
jgi:hypothetical protein